MIRDPDTFNQLLDSVNRFVRERLAPAEHQVAETDEIPEDIVRDMKALGLFGLTVPEEYGGLGLTMEEEVEVMFAMGQTSPCFRSLFGTTVGIGSQGILFDGTEAQKKKYLPKMATGEVIGAIAMTEPGTGSDLQGVRTTAIRQGDHYVLRVVGESMIDEGIMDGDFIIVLRRGTAEPGEMVVARGRRSTPMA